MTKTYSFVHGLSKGLVQFVIFSFPFFVELLPAEWLNLTVGGVLTVLYNYLKFKWNISRLTHSQ